MQHLASSWEDVSSMPGQMTFSGKKKVLLDAYAGVAALTQAVTITEN